jgi:phage FluMu protein Com
MYDKNLVEAMKEVDRAKCSLILPSLVVFVASVAVLMILYRLHMRVSPILLSGMLLPIALATCYCGVKHSGLKRKRPEPWRCLACRKLLDADQIEMMVRGKKCPYCGEMFSETVEVEDENKANATS